MNNIKNIRESRGVSRSELHRLTGIPVRTLEDLEFNKIITVKYHRLKKIAEVLNCTVDDLMVRKENAVLHNKDVSIELELVEEGTLLTIYNDTGHLLSNDIVTNDCGNALVNHLKNDPDISDFMDNQISYVE